jgi:hypothetical protein
MMRDIIRKFTPGGNDNEEADEAGPPFESPAANNAQAVQPGTIHWTPSYGYSEEAEMYHRSYYISSWPARASEHMFWDLLTDTSLQYDMTIHFNRQDPLDAVSDLDTLSTRLEEKVTGPLSSFTLNPESAKRTAQVIDQMKESIEQSGENLFRITAYITLYAESKDALRKKHNQLEDETQLNAGVSIETTTYEQDIGFRGSSPLGFNEYYDRHGDDVSQLMTGSVAAAMFPYASDTVFEQGGVNFGTNLASNTYTVIDPFDRPTGYHMLRLGRIGSGKTFGASQYLIRLAQQIENVNITIIDPMRDFVGVNHTLAADRILIDGTENINPLEIQPTPEHVLEKAEGKLNPFNTKLREVEWFFTRFFSIEGEPLDAKSQSILTEAVRRAYDNAGISGDPQTHSRPSPTITDVREILADMNKRPEKYADPATDNLIQKYREYSGNLRIALEPFREGRRYSNLAQPTSIDLGSSKVTYIDMNAISANSSTMDLMLQLLFSLVYQESKQVRGPSVITIDEAHKVLQDTDSVSFLEEVFRHGRHFDLSVQLISQTFEEFFVNESARTIARQCSMVQLHQMDRIDTDVAKNAMGLNEKQIEYISSLQPGDGNKNYSDALLQISDKGTIPLRVKPTPDEKAVIDYDPTKDWDELTRPKDKRIQKALDARTKHDTPIVNPGEDDLGSAVINEVMSKQREVLSLLRNKGVGIEEFLATDELAGTELAEETLNSSTETDTTGIGTDTTDAPIDDEQLLRTATETTTSTANNEPRQEEEDIKAQTSTTPAGDNEYDRDQNQTTQQNTGEQVEDQEPSDTKETDSGDDQPTPMSDRTLAGDSSQSQATSNKQEQAPEPASTAATRTSNPSEANAEPASTPANPQTDAEHTQTQATSGEGKNKGEQEQTDTKPTDTQSDVEDNTNESNTGWSAVGATTTENSFEQFEPVVDTDEINKSGKSDNSDNGSESNTEDTEDSADTTQSNAGQSANDNQFI